MFTTLSQASRALDVATITVRRRMDTLGIQPAAVLANGTVLLDDNAMTRLRAAIAPTSEPILSGAMIHRDPSAAC